MIKKIRDRVCAAILNDKNEILMVYTEDGDHHFWTLPGGGIEEGETHEEATMREVFEEVNLNVQVNELLFIESYKHGSCYCYLVHRIDENQVAKLGQDPELELDKQVLKKIAWKDMNTFKDDKQVSKVISALRRISKEVGQFCKG